MDPLRLVLGTVAVLLAAMVIAGIILEAKERREQRAADQMRRASDDLANYRRSERAALFEKVRAARRQQDRDPQYRMQRNPGGGIAS